MSNGVSRDSDNINFYFAVCCAETATRLRDILRRRRRLSAMASQDNVVLVRYITGTALLLFVSLHVQFHNFDISTIQM